MLSFNGTTFINQTDSNIDHRKTLSLGSYKEQPFTTGGTWTNTKKTEIFNFDLNTWELVDDYPFAEGHFRLIIFAEYNSVMVQS